MIGRKGGDPASIRLPQPAVPPFRYVQNGSGGAGQGDGDAGQPSAGGGKSGKKGDGKGQAGREAGAHILEVEVPVEELAAILGDELELPRIQPKGKASIKQEKSKYDSIRRSGPESLRHFKRTYFQALRRQITTGTYDPQRPTIMPIPDDKRYRSWSTVQEPEANALIIYMMDVSGSMTDEQKELVRTEAFWIDTWLTSQYDGVDVRYIIHDAVARVVDENTFYHTRESGGTRISSAYKAASDLIRREFNPAEWNIYCFQFSDGDNWGEDNDQSLRLLGEDLLPAVNLFCYGQVESPYGSGEYIRALKGRFGEKQEKLVLSEIEDKEDIYPTIKAFLRKGK